MSKFKKRNAEQQKVADLWEDLRRAGAFKLPQARLDTWLRRNYGVADPIFLSPDDTREAAKKLSAWLGRARGRTSNEYPIT